ncbi:endothelin-converting enzyme-like 1 [Stegodyphus dumicola]|uniref:endothelin-converting enzyme-like 1 n=1 Tax=Stegodyphus dumicola TaxID=202533 RepID=UPI0015A89CBB|nr:endothelin-converting enzyme-like 1 [Stegodyphus dumicola]
MHSLIKQINMKKIQDDVVAVSGGLRAAYWAYRAWVAEHQTELKPLALNHYTQNQLFWISAANVQCEKANQGYMQESIRAGTVISQKFRLPYQLL